MPGCLVYYKEIFKLKVMLDKANIDYEFWDRSWVYDYTIKYPSYQIVVYKPGRNERLISVVEGYGTYGEEDDLLEIMGCLTKKEEKENSVKGCLTAEEVFKRIKRNMNKIERDD